MTTPADHPASKELPASLSINAWSGSGPTGTTRLAPNWHQWIRQSRIAAADRFMFAPEPADPGNWLDPRVGWGLLVADDDTLSESARAAGQDLPDVLRKLVAFRQGVVLRYRKDAGVEFIRRYYTDKPAQDLSLLSSPGTARGSLPQYLLIWASPAINERPGWIPWRFQYTLSVGRCVGRVHLIDQALENYVNAVLNDWVALPSRSDWPVIWAVDHADSDITHLMRQVVAEPVEMSLRLDPQIGDRLRYYARDAATVGQLIEALVDPARSPAFVLTSSHGMTGPLDDLPRMASSLGLPVDQHGAMLDLAALVARWEPNGVIWYSHACCSAGSDSATQYGDLLESGSVKDTLEGVARLGARVAPLPTVLLGAARPARAFIGHVEPTFDWTLRHPETGQRLTQALCRALYDGMYRKRPEPVGLAFKDWYAQAGQLFAQYQLVRPDTMAVDPVARLRARTTALRVQLGALDRQACVILGDPAVTLPPLD